MKPSIQFLEHIATNPDKIFENYINKEINRRNKTTPVNGYMDTNTNTNTNYNYDNDSNSSVIIGDDKCTTDKIVKKIKSTKSTKSTKTNNIDDTNDNNNTNEKLNSSEDRLINKIKTKTNIKQSLTINI